MILTGTTELISPWTPDGATQTRVDERIDMLGLTGLAGSEASTWLTMSARELFLTTVDELHRP